MPQASSTPRRRTQQERTAESTQRLITAAIELIAEKGFAKTSTAEISERAGYSRSMVQFKYGYQPRPDARVLRALLRVLRPVQSLNSWINDWLDRYLEATTQALENGRADGSIRPDIEPPTEASAFLASGLGHSFRWMVSPGTVDYLAL